MSRLLDEIRDWLDTETSALLCDQRPRKETAIDMLSYSLWLLKRGDDTHRVDEIVTMIQESNPVLSADHPFVIAQGLTEEEAMAGQFALACCDCVTAFVRDDIIRDASPKYLRQLHDEILASAEFERVNVTILHIPNSEEARRFCWQFLGLATGVAVPANRRVFRKKARLMEHWAEKSAIKLQIE